MAQLIDLSDEILVDIFFWVPYNAVSGSHKVLCLVNRGIHSIMYENSLPKKIIQKQLIAYHQLHPVAVRTRSSNRGKVVVFTGRDAYTRELWYKQERLLVLHEALKESGIPDVVCQTSIALADLVANCQHQLREGALQPLNWGPPQGWVREGITILFKARLARELPGPALSLLRLITRLIMDFPFPLEGRIGCPWLQDLGPLLTQFMKNNILDILGPFRHDFVRANLRPLTPETSSHVFISPYTSGICHLLLPNRWTMPDVTKDVYWYLSLAPHVALKRTHPPPATIRTVRMNRDYDELEDAHFSRSEDLLTAEALEMHSVDKDIKELFKDDKRAAFIIDSLDLAQVGAKVEAVFNGVAGIRHENIQEELEKECQLQGFYDWPWER